MEARLGTTMTTRGIRVRANTRSANIMSIMEVPLQVLALKEEKFLLMRLTCQNQNIILRPQKVKRILTHIDLSLEMMNIVQALPRITTAHTRFLKGRDIIVGVPRHRKVVTKETMIVIKEI